MIECLLGRSLAACVDGRVFRENGYIKRCQKAFRGFGLGRTDLVATVLPGLLQQEIVHSFPLLFLLGHEVPFH